MVPSTKVVFLTTALLYPIEGADVNPCKWEICLLRRKGNPFLSGKACLCLLSPMKVGFFSRRMITDYGGILEHPQKARRHSESSTCR